MSLPSFQLLRPRTVDETMSFLAKYPGRYEDCGRGYRPAAVNEAEALYAALPA